MERDLGASDWDDIDLLTTDEATVRLDEEIEALRGRLAAGETAAGHRLDLLVAARERLARRRKFNFPKV